MAGHFDKYVPDSGPLDARILLVGEAPGETEHMEGLPFVGQSGSLLINCLGRAGVAREDVRLANLCHYRPHGNSFEQLLNTDALKNGLAELYLHIQAHRPTVIGALGAWPLKFMTGKTGIMKWRGSILSYILDEGIKVIPTVHPAAVLRDRTLYPTFDLDIKRIVSDAAFPDKNLPRREFVTDPRGLLLEEWTQKLCSAKYLATDIETVKRSTHILCVGFAPSPHVGVCINPNHPEGRAAISRILESPAKKIFQFGSFDTQQLHANGYLINDPSAEELGRYYWWDTLIAQHVVAPELPRSLEYLTSIHTREPYYKTEGRGTIPADEKSWSSKMNQQSLYEYNVRDCCCTAEVYERQLEEADDAFYNMFNYEMDMLEIAGHISEAGIAIDDARREMLEQTLLTKWGKKQFILDRLTGFETNVRSPKLKEILYDHMGLPTRRKRDGKITTDEDAIVSLITFCKDKLNGVSRKDAVLDWTVKLKVCQTILEIRGIRVLLSNYILKEQRNKTSRVSADGRARSTYKVGGTETGRWAASKFVDGTGFNTQTIPRDPTDVPDEVAAEYAALANELGDDEGEDETVEEAA